MLAGLWLQFGASGSLTVTFCRVSWPVLVTVIVKLAVAPLAIDCDFGFLTIAIDGVPPPPPPATAAAGYRDRLVGGAARRR